MLYRQLIPHPLEESQVCHIVSIKPVSKFSKKNQLHKSWYNLTFNLNPLIYLLVNLRRAMEIHFPRLSFLIRNQMQLA